jgi:CRP-like cAMP-binding protein
MAHPEPHLLEGLSPEQSAEVMALGARTRLASGGVLFRLGAAADDVFIVERGRISLTLPMQVGGVQREVLVEERLPGQLVGWSGLVPPHRFTLNASAQLDTELIALPRAALLAHFADRPAVGYVLSRNLAAVVGHRLQVLQAMWLREMQRALERHCA